MTEQFDIFHGPITVGRPEPLYKIYKIRRKADGLFSTGGSYPRWNVSGKSWLSLKALSGHLSLHKKRYGHGGNIIPFDQLEIVGFDVAETECIDVVGYVQNMEARRKKRRG